MIRRLLPLLLALATILVGAALAGAVQRSGGVTVSEVSIPAPEGLKVSGLLYRPAIATAARPTPAILASHGYINTREMQSAFAIELARRGYVVLAMDMTGHGYSGGIVGTHGFGGPAALTWLRAQPFVDPENVGLIGHSMGGGPILAAAAEQPDGYRAIVLVGSTPGLLGAKAPESMRNLAVVFGGYDEFAPLMWQVPKGFDIVRSPKLLKLFGTQAPVTPRRIYGDVSAGTARVLYVPAVTHPGEHFSNAGVAPAIEWFQATVPGAHRPKGSGDQLWIWKEVGTLIAFLGFVGLILASFDILLRTRPFASLVQPGIAPVERRDGRWWLAFALTAAVPALTYFPLMKAGQLFFPMLVFPQWVQNQLLVWALANALIALVIGLVLRRPKPQLATPWLPSLGLALTVMAIGYLSLVAVDAIFKVDYRFWVLGMKPLSAGRALIAIPYVLLWTAFFLVSLRALAGLAVRGDRLGTHLAAAMGAMALGFLGLVIFQYAGLFTTGVLTIPSEPLNTIVAIQFIPLLAVVGLIGAYAWRRTNSHLPGALICALLIAWYVSSGTANHRAPGFEPQLPGAPAKAR